MNIAIDFDGTCVTHEFPKIGKDNLMVLLKHPEPTTYFQYENLVAVVLKNEIVKTVMEYDKKKWKPVKK